MHLEINGRDTGKIRIIYAYIYHSPKSSHSQFLNYLEQVFDCLGDHFYRIVILGDFNINWENSSFHTKKLKKLIIDASLKQLVQEPTRVTDNSTSTIEFVVSNRVVEWIVLNKPMISDHNIISIRIPKSAMSTNNAKLVKIKKVR